MGQWMSPWLLWTNWNCVQIILCVCAFEHIAFMEKFITSTECYKDLSMETIFRWYVDWLSSFKWGGFKQKLDYVMEVIKIGCFLQIPFWTNWLYLLYILTSINADSCTCCSKNRKKWLMLMLQKFIWFERNDHTGKGET